MRTGVAPARVTVALTMAVAGCLGAPVPETTGEGPPVAPTSQAPALVDTLRWNGTVAGPNVVAASFNPDILRFELRDSLSRLDLTLRAEGGEGLAWVFPAGCRDRDCGERVDTAEGGTWSLDAPPAGPWELHVAKADPGAAPVAYALEIALWE